MQPGDNIWVLEITNGNLALFPEVAHALDMGRFAVLLLILLLVVLASVRLHHYPGGFLGGESWSVEFEWPWR